MREKIIKLAQTLRPAPAIPEEAERHMAYGATAMKEAKSETDYQDAVVEFKKATLAAPWLANAYYNLGIAQSKVGAYDEAVQSLGLYLTVAPDAEDARQAKTLMFEMEFRANKVRKEEVELRDYSVDFGN